MVKDSFQSTVSNNRDIVDDIISILDDASVRDNNDVGYKIIEPVETKYAFEIKNVAKIEKPFPKNINQKLFHQTEGIFNDYVEVEDAD